MDVMETLEGIGIALTAFETALFTFVPFAASLYALTLYEYSVPVVSYFFQGILTFRISSVNYISCNSFFFLP